MSEKGTSDPQTGMDRVFGTLRGMGIQRRTDDKWVAGVCSGIADRMGVDPVIVRAGFVLLALLGGVGITIYLVAWALTPNDRDEIAAQRALRDGDGGSIVLVIFAAMSLFGGSAFGGSWLGGHSGWGFPWGLLFLGFFIWWLVKRSGNNNLDADQRVRTQQLDTARPVSPSPMRGGPLPSAAGPVVPQTQVMPRTSVAPRKPRRRSGGPLMALLAIGLALATYGSLLWLGNTFSWTGDHQTIALAGALAATGLLTVVLGIAGWRAGFVTFLAVVLAMTAWSSAVVPSGIQLGGRVGDATWTPTSVGSNPSYHLGVGNGVLDLGGLPTDGLSTVTIPASVGIGDLKVLVPQGLTVQVVGHVGLGEILSPTDPGSSGGGGSDVHRLIVVGDGPTEVLVNAEVGLGQLTVVKE